MKIETIIERLQSGIDDPMWADHAEMDKATLKFAVTALAGQTKQGRAAEGAVSDFHGAFRALFRRASKGMAFASELEDLLATQPTSASPVAVPMTNDQWHALDSAADALDYLVKDGTYGDVAVRHSATIRSMLATQPALPDAALDSQKGGVQ